MPGKGQKEVSSKTAKKSTVAKKVGNSKKGEELKNLDGLADKSHEWNSESTDASVEDSDDESDKKSDTDHAHKTEEDEDEDDDEEDDENENEDKNDENDKVTKPNTSAQFHKKLAAKKPVSVLHNDKAPHKDAFQKEQPLLRGRVSVNKPARSNVSYGDKTDGYNLQSIAKFSPYEYRDSTVQLKDASVADLLKSAIVKSRDVGQKHLMNVLYQTLKATNMECEFPLITDRKQRNQPKKNTYDNKDRNGRYRDDF